MKYTLGMCICFIAAIVLQPKPTATPAPATPQQQQLVQIQVPGQPPKQLLMTAEQLTQLQTLQAQGNVSINLQGGPGGQVNIVTSPPAPKPQPQPAQTLLRPKAPSTVSAAPSSGLPAGVAPPPPGMLLVRTSTGQLAYVRQASQLTSQQQQQQHQQQMTSPPPGAQSAGRSSSLNLKGGVDTMSSMRVSDVIIVFTITSVLSRLSNTYCRCS